MEQIKIINIKELAAELNTTPKALRKWLRDHNLNKPGKRWEWEEGHKDLERIKQLRNEYKRGRKKAVKVEVEKSRTVQARKEEEQPKEIIIAINHQPSGGKEWIAEIIGNHPRFKFERKFISPTSRNWSSSGKTGTTSFSLEEGKVYEVNEPWKGRYFVKVENGKTIDVTVDDIKKKYLRGNKK